MTSFNVQRKCVFQKYCRAKSQWYWKKRWKWISPASSSVFEVPDSCIYWPKTLNFCLQTLGFLCQHVVQNGNFLIKKIKMSQNFQKSFLGLFYVCFACKWCATLSSAVSSGGPEGQVARFNANVWFKNISVPYVNDIERNVENGHLQQVLQYLKLRIHAHTDPKG